MELRDYQLKAVSDVYTAIKQGNKKVVLASCTGSGKTVVMGKIAADAVSKNRRVLVVVDDSPLIKQTVNKLRNFGVEPGVIKAGFRENRDAPCQVASIDTLIRRCYPPADVVLVDECHLSYAKKYNQLFSLYEGKIFIGFSATPERTNRREKLGDRWDYLVRSLSIAEAVAINANVPPLVYSLKRNSLGLKSIKTQRGDYDQSDLGLKMTDPNVVKLAVETWIKKGENRPTIAFTVNIQHSKVLLEEFQNSGIASGRLDGETSETERELLYHQLRTGQIKVLISINVLTIGFDEPSVSCILCCRPTKSKIMWIQIVGRGLRLFEGKEDCIILDQSENTYNLLHPLEYTPQELNQPPQPPGEAPVKECPECEAVLPNFTATCPHCGYVFPQKVKQTSHGELEVVAPIVTDPRILKQQSEYKSWIKQAFQKDYNPDWAAMQFKQNYGFFPSTLIRRHALLGLKPPGEKIQQYREYLSNIAHRKNKPESWVKKHLTYELGSH